MAAKPDERPRLGLHLFKLDSSQSSRNAVSAAEVYAALTNPDAFQPEDKRAGVMKAANKAINRYTKMMNE